MPWCARAKKENAILSDYLGMARGQIYGIIVNERFFSYFLGLGFRCLGFRRLEYCFN